ncbi:hypothetical protein G7074_11490 [Pedobacter sp. HDW13]|uniref:hypothetical protein n=1 Tax=Pedobacter sp. HDW13 TaxID=2714940 RepID=UPI00140C96B2|nr:hypothetical protein [Pedobacter sp. HDW13]QIL39831.1 hypothetical protein G7074_11490 [Pedobacter sp. HDW13]
MKRTSLFLKQCIARNYLGKDGKKLYVIWKGGSTTDEPFYDWVIQNWQTVASVAVSKESE